MTRAGTVVLTIAIVGTAVSAAAAGANTAALMRVLLASAIIGGLCQELVDPVAERGQRLADGDRLRAAVVDPVGRHGSVPVAVQGTAQVVHEHRHVRDGVRLVWR